MPPNHLAVYLSNRCNLGCRYCYVAVNQGEPAYLTFEQLAQNLDYFLESVPGPQKKITFLGGEPFLNFPLFQRAVDYVRERGGEEVVLQTFTNGVNLDRQKLDWCDDRRVFVTVSLDGDRRTNDRNRVFHGDSSRSVFDAVMSRLEGLPKHNLGVSLVFDSRSVEGLIHNVEFFRRMGFGRITFNPELYEIWSEDRLAVLRSVMEGFRKYYALVLQTDVRPFTIPILFSVLETERRGSGWWHECHNVVLGSDNQFYSCDKALSFPYERLRGSGVGDVVQGMDWDRRAGELAEARAVVERILGVERRQYFCPMGVVFYSRFAGIPPEQAVLNFARVSEIFGGALQQMVSDLSGAPAFRALYHDVQLV